MPGRFRIVGLAALVYAFGHAASSTESPVAPRPPEPWRARLARAFPTDELDKPRCAFRNSSRDHCRDQRSYVRSNESRRCLFAPYVRDLGGGYVGIAADANYDLIAAARSRWVWLLDHDPVIVDLHRLLGALVLRSPTPRDFVARFKEAGKDRDKSATERLIARAFPDDPGPARVYRRYRAELHGYYQASARPRADKECGDFGWLRNEHSYNYIRALWKQKRVIVAPGDLLKTQTLRGIGRVARMLGVKIRVYYPSNAEEYWKLNAVYRRNVESLPFDERSVALRTLSPFRMTAGKRRRLWDGGGRGYWHYVVHRGLDFQRKVGTEGYETVDDWKSERRLSRNPRLSLIGF